MRDALIILAIALAAAYIICLLPARPPAVDGHDGGSHVERATP